MSTRFYGVKVKEDTPIEEIKNIKVFEQVVDGERKEVVLFAGKAWPFIDYFDAYEDHGIPRELTLPDLQKFYIDLARAYLKKDFDIIGGLDQITSKFSTVEETAGDYWYYVLNMLNDVKYQVDHLEEGYKYYWWAC